MGTCHLWLPGEKGVLGWLLSIRGLTTLPSAGRPIHPTRRILEPGSPAAEASATFRDPTGQGVACNNTRMSVCQCHGTTTYSSRRVCKKVKEIPGLIFPLGDPSDRTTGRQRKHLVAFPSWQGHRQSQRPAPEITISCHGASQVNRQTVTMKSGQVPSKTTD